MKRIQLLGVGILAILAINILAATTAQAKHLQMLPANAKFTFASKAGEPTILRTLGGKKVECEKVEGTAESASERLGTAKFLFEKCLSEGLACTGLKAEEPSGDIEVVAEFHLRHLLIGGKTQGIDLVILVGHVHFTCVIFLFLVLGCVASDDILTKANGVLADKLLLTSAFVNFLESAENSGDPKNPEIDTDNSLGMESCSLLTKEGAGEKVYESSSQRGSGTITVNTGTFLLDLNPAEVEV